MLNIIIIDIILAPRPAQPWLLMNSTNRVMKLAAAVVFEGIVHTNMNTMSGLRAVVQTRNLQHQRPACSSGDLKGDRCRPHSRMISAAYSLIHHRNGMIVCSTTGTRLFPADLPEIDPKRGRFYFGGAPNHLPISKIKFFTKFYGHMVYRISTPLYLRPVKVKWEWSGQRASTNSINRKSGCGF